MLTSPSHPAPGAEPSHEDGPTFAERQRARRRQRQRRVLLMASGVFAAYYVVFRLLGIYNDGAMAVGLGVAAGLVASGLALPRASIGQARGLELMVAAMLGVGAVASATVAGGSHCMGFHAIWALPLIYGLVFPEATLGTALVGVIGTAGGVGILLRDGDDPERVVHWATLAVAALVFGVIRSAMARRESAEIVADTEVPLRALVQVEARRAEENAALAASLRQRTDELARTNDRLTTSLGELGSAQEQLVHAGTMEAIGRLAGGVAHDFNNLLTVILATTSAVREDLAASPTAQGELGDVVKAAEQAAAICRQLLALSRKQVQHIESLDLAEVTQELTRILRRVLGERITTQVDIEPVPRVQADRSQIEQVLLNLIVNARDALPNGGSISLSLREATAEQRAHAQGLDPTAEYVALVVADDGAGMDAETVARVFEPFFSTKEVGQGTGLGLAVVYGIIAQSGGHISCESRPAGGTRFTVLLRASRPDELARASEAAAAPSPSRRRGTVLVVEDEDALRRIAGQILQKSGWSVLLARDGVHALEVAAAASGPIDLLLTDIGMPRMGGIELAQALRRERPDLVVAFMSGYAFELSASADTFPGVGCLQKPFTPAALDGFVRRQLEGPRQT